MVKARVVSDLDPPFRSRSPSGVRASSNVQDVMARGQRLVDEPRPPGGYPLAWHVEAMYLGDLTATAGAALRAAGFGSRPSTRR